MLGEGADSKRPENKQTKEQMKNSGRVALIEQQEGGSAAALGSLFSDRFPMCSSSIVFSVRVIVCLFSLLFC